MDSLTELQRIILEIDALDVPLREAVRLANARVGFFVGQQRYKEELAKALQLIAEPEAEPAEVVS